MSYSWSDWDLCRTCRAHSLRFSRPTASFSWYKPVVVLSRSGANCVNSACNRRSRSSTVASRLGPGGGGVISFVGIMIVPSSVWLSSVAMGVAGGLFIIGDHWRAAVSNVWNPEVNAATIMAFFITGRIVSKYWEKQSSSTTWPSPTKQSIMCTITGYG